MLKHMKVDELKLAAASAGDRETTENGVPCPRCGKWLKQIGKPWDWDFVCDKCGRIPDGELGDRETKSEEK